MNWIDRVILCFWPDTFLLVLLSLLPSSDLFSSRGGRCHRLTSYPMHHLLHNLLLPCSLLRNLSIFFCLPTSILLHSIFYIMFTSPRCIPQPSHPCLSQAFSQLSDLCLSSDISFLTHFHQYQWAHQYLHLCIPTALSTFYTSPWDMHMYLYTKRIWYTSSYLEEIISAKSCKMFILLSNFKTGSSKYAN